MVDTLALGASAARHEGSSPFLGTTMHIPVIFEDGNILVIDKPSGTVVHPFDFSNEETVLDFLHEKCPGMFSIRNEIMLQDGRVIPLGGIVHKLDRDTSGVLVVAKNQQTFDELRKLFTDRKMEKTYVALVEGSVEKDIFTIDAPLGRSKKDYKQSVAPKDPRGPLREAVTEVKVLKRNNDTTLVELVPRTGRTHQLRAHLSGIGHPIVGDKAYGSNIENERILLHAASLMYTTNGKHMFFSAPLADIFTQS